MRNLKNKFLMAPLKLGYCDTPGEINSKHLNFYELRSKLVDRNNRITIVEMLAEIADGMEMIEKALTVKKLKDKHAVIYTKHKVIEVQDDKIIIENENGIKKIEKIEKIVVTIGMKTYAPFENYKNIPVYKIGDAKKAGKAQEAIYDAYELAAEL